MTGALAHPTRQVRAEAAAAPPGFSAAGEGARVVPDAPVAVAPLRDVAPGGGGRAESAVPARGQRDVTLKNKDRGRQNVARRVNLDAGLVQRANADMLQAALDLDAAARQAAEADAREAAAQAARRAEARTAARTARAQQNRIKGLQQALEYKRSQEAEAVARAEAAEAAHRAEVARAAEAAEAREAENECIVCRAQLKTVAFIPCNHRAACTACAARILATTPSQCPTCRQPVSGYQEHLKIQEFTTQQ